MDCICSGHWLPRPTYCLQVGRVWNGDGPGVAALASATTSNPRVLAPRIRCNRLASELHLLRLVRSSPHTCFIIIIPNRIHLSLLDEEIWLSILLLLLLVELVLAVLFVRQGHFFARTYLCIVIHSLKCVVLRCLLLHVFFFLHLP